MELAQSQPSIGIRELSFEEVSAVSGGPAPLAYIAGKITVKLIARVVATDAAIIVGAAAYSETREQD